MATHKTDSPKLALETEGLSRKVANTPLPTQELPNSHSPTSTPGPTAPPKPSTAPVEPPPPKKGTGSVPVPAPTQVHVDPVPPTKGPAESPPGKTPAGSGPTPSPSPSASTAPAPFRWWQRLEPYPQDQALERSLEARVHDAAWLLARQWQLGEFRGENAASPIAVKIQSVSAPLRGFRPGDPLDGNAWQRYDPAATPLEALVEREPATLGRIAPDGTWLFTQLRLASRAGEHLLRLCASALVEAGLGGNALTTELSQLRASLLLTYPIPDPVGSRLCTPEAHRHWSAIRGRIPDGVRMRLACLEHDDPTGWLESWLDASQKSRAASLKTAVTGWLEWWSRQLSEPSDETAAWAPERLSYDFALSTQADGRVGSGVFHAHGYEGGRVDWSTFDLDATTDLKIALSNPVEHSASVIPQPVSFAGMPLARFWSFEDQAINFAAVDVQEDDLARLALLDFMLLYSNDWFQVPLRQPVGSYLQLKPLQVFDAFGETYTIDQTSSKIGGGGWSMFHLSHLDGRSSQSGLLLVPSLEGGLEGRSIEEVRFSRDELANLAWAVEERVEGVDGQSFLRHTFQSPTTSSAGSHTLEPPQRELGSPAYQLASGVPEHWIPLVPVRISGRKDILLRRAQLSWPDANGKTFTPLRPEGRLLTEARRLDIPEREIPRSGVKVTRAHQFARWSDGSGHLWLGRRRRLGGGESSSRFGWDVLIPPGTGEKPVLDPPEARADSTLLDFSVLK